MGPRISAADRVVAFIHSYIREHGLKPGDPLPTEREIARRTGVSRATVREGLGRLRALGFIRTRTKTGARLSRTDPKIILAEVVPTLAQTKSQIRYLAEFRAVIESGAAALAAKRRSASDIRKLEEIVTLQQGARRKGIAEFDALDKAFHLQILRSAHNRLILAAVHVIGSYIDNPPTPRGEITKEQWDTIMTRSYLEHAMILNAIKKRDVSEARTVMRIHVESAVESLRVFV